MKAQPFKAIVSDANVVIDYVKANKKVLQLAVKHLCEIRVPVPVLKEVQDISRSELEKLGIIIFEPTIAQLTQAAQKPFGLSFQDQLCLLIAKENSWVCATNDKQLRVQCEAGSVEVIWGLDIMLILNKQGFLECAEATKTAEKIAEINRYISKEIIKQFIGKLI
jgi:predicted nucleic acid-binding protein